MKKTKKVRSTALSIVPLLISILVSNGNNATKAIIEEHLENDCESVALFVEENLSTFVSEYNASSEKKWFATSVEDKKKVINVTNNSRAIYLDFNDDNGYAVVGMIMYF